jgi:putative nucleotidyltransferase with HDIG domain
LQEIVRALKDKPDEALKELREIGELINGLVPYQDGHSLRVSEYALAIAKALKFNKKELIMVEAAALLHDIGKIGIDKEILSKPQTLTRREKEEIEKHVLRGYVMLAEFTDIPQILNGVTSHHECWDGSGYPYGLRNTEIPLIGRILAVADAYDAMTSQRPYRAVYSKDEAITELKVLSGIQFDAHIVKIFLRVLNKLHKSRSKKPQEGTTIFKWDICFLIAIM